MHICGHSIEHLLIEFRMLVMFASTNSNSSLVAPWRQQGLEIEWASLKGPIAKEIVNITLVYPPQRLIVPSAIAGKQGLVETTTLYSQDIFFSRYVVFSHNSGGFVDETVDGQLFNTTI